MMIIWCIEKAKHKRKIARRNRSMRKGQRAIFEITTNSEKKYIIHRSRAKVTQQIAGEKNWPISEKNSNGIEDLESRYIKWTPNVYGFLICVSRADEWEKRIRCVATMQFLIHLAQMTVFGMHPFYFYFFSISFYFRFFVSFPSKIKIKIRQMWKKISCKRTMKTSENALSNLR